MCVCVSLTSQTRKSHKNDGATQAAHSFIFGFHIQFKILPNKWKHEQIGNINDHSSRNWQWINDICTINRFIALFEIDAETTYRYSFESNEIQLQAGVCACVYAFEKGMNNSASCIA